MVGLGALLLVLVVLSAGFWMCWRLLDAVERSELEKASRVALEARRRQVHPHPLLLRRVSRR